MAEKTYVGLTIKAVRHATEKEAEAIGLEDDRRRVAVIELSDGTLIAPSRDDEGNGPGVFFTLEPDGTTGGIG